ncbi:hypothetical protein BDV28DRAFT_134382 [Aspergillus coremiiformis]|uniref:Transmembrane protein n=1 Tax=Aspergillus coremiiformis TaxID=138285 RepID=A0A5N6Z5B4_9EURO|nr:hypothetical protein BDV28DRAFT_134382 [Aspergillus coremiiformis]
MAKFGQFDHLPRPPSFSVQCGNLGGLGRCWGCDQPLDVLTVGLRLRPFLIVLVIFSLVRTKNIRGKHKVCQ